MNTVRLITLVTVFLASVNAIAGQVSVAVAANFTAPMQLIGERFEAQSGHHLQLTFASSGKIVAQIQNGAPFDVFLSADTAKPAALIEQQQAVAASRFTYAVGTLALWSADAGKNAKRVLDNGQFNKLAIANPRLAPYGEAAVQALQKLGLEKTVQPRLVMGENIAQTYQFVATGNADIGFVALSQIIKDGKAPANAWIVPAAMHSPIQQDAVILKHGESNKAAAALMQFLHRDPEALAIIHQFGYATGE